MVLSEDLFLFLCLFSVFQLFFLRFLEFLHMTSGRRRRRKRQKRCAAEDEKTDRRSSEFPDQRQECIPAQPTDCLSFHAVDVLTSNLESWLHLVTMTEPPFTEKNVHGILLNAICETPSYPSYSYEPG